MRSDQQLETPMSVSDSQALFEITLRVDDPVFFSTKEMNKRVTTGRFLHNYALTYALLHAGGNLEALSDYSRQHERSAQNPRYEQDLGELPFYIFPAVPEAVEFTSEIVNTKAETFEEMMTGDRGKRYFSAHEIRRIAVGSTFRTVAVAEQPTDFPGTSPIRLGKFRNKVRLEIKQHSPTIESVEQERVSVALNTVDLPESFSATLSSIEMINMRPTPLLTAANYTGEAYVIGNGDIVCPTGVHYFSS
jgi:CRISPR-associated protein Csc1